jgi:dUTP pyrophosphatase
MIPYALLPNAKEPVRAHRSDAAVDLFVCFDKPDHVIRLFPRQRVLVGTGVFAAIPDGYYGQIAERSGLAFGSGVGVLGGVIDAGYRGEIKAIIVNHGPSYFEITHHAKIAQLIVLPINVAEWVKVESLSAWGGERGDAGFGSTGQ